MFPLEIPFRNAPFKSWKSLVTQRWPWDGLSDRTLTSTADFNLMSRSGVSSCRMRLEASSEWTFGGPIENSSAMIFSGYTWWNGCQHGEKHPLAANFTHLNQLLKPLSPFFPVGQGGALRPVQTQSETCHPWWVERAWLCQSCRCRCHAINMGTRTEWLQFHIFHFNGISMGFYKPSIQLLGSHGMFHSIWIEFHKSAIGTFLLHRNMFMNIIWWWMMMVNTFLHINFINQLLDLPWLHDLPWKVPPS